MNPYKASIKQLLDLADYIYPTYEDNYSTEPPKAAIKKTRRKNVPKPVQEQTPKRRLHTAASYRQAMVRKSGGTALKQARSQKCASGKTKSGSDSNALTQDVHESESTQRVGTTPALGIYTERSEVYIPIPLHINGDLFSLSSLFLLEGCGEISLSLSSLFFDARLQRLREIAEKPCFDAHLRPVTSLNGLAAMADVSKLESIRARLGMSTISQPLRPCHITPRAEKFRRRKVFAGKGEWKKREYYSDVDSELIRDMGMAYQNVLRQYMRNDFIQVYPNTFDESKSKPSCRIFLAAAKTAREIDMDFEYYVKAQFYWWHTWFGKFPLMYQIAGGSGKCDAKWRALKYRQLDSKTPIKVLSTNPVRQQVVVENKGLRDKASFGKLIAREMEQNEERWSKLGEKEIAKFKAQGMSVEEMFLNNWNKFPRVWLSKHPVWKKLVNSGCVDAEIEKLVRLGRKGVEEENLRKRLHIDEDRGVKKDLVWYESKLRSEGLTVKEQIEWARLLNAR